MLKRVVTGVGCIEVDEHGTIHKLNGNAVSAYNGAVLEWTKFQRDYYLAFRFRDGVRFRKLLLDHILKRDRVGLPVTDEERELGQLTLQEWGAFWQNGGRILEDR